MKIMKLIIDVVKYFIRSSMLLILIAAIILISIRDYTTNDNLKELLEIVSIALFGVYFIYETYKDLKNNKYETYQYIILVDIVILLVFAFMCYLNYKNYDTTDALIMSGSYIRWSSLIISMSCFIRSYLQNEKFIKK